MADNKGNYTTEQVVDAWQKEGGNISATSRALRITRSTIQQHLAKAGVLNKPLAEGQKIGREAKKALLPAKGLIKRYILTSAQNNTHVNKEFWASLLTLADHYDAEVLVGTFSYNQNNYGQLAVKAGKKKQAEHELWFDPLIKDFINDERIELANGLVWCGEMNILPTAVNPLEGLETYSHRKSAIFPHVKVAMRSIPTMQGEGTKLNYTTGTVTLKNYIQKKEGLKAEHHHRYAALVVEVDHNGYWCVRQVGWSSRNDYLQDLDVVVKGSKVTTGNTVEAITWGDLHATIAEPWVVDLSIQMLDYLKPKYQFLHDVMEGTSINRHYVKNAPLPHQFFHRWLRGLHRVDAELTETLKVINRYLRPWCTTVVPDSNHDGWWLKSWLAKFDYRYDPANAELFLKLQAQMYKEIREGKMPKDVNITEAAFAAVGLEAGTIKFLLPDESFKTCHRKIENGMHGHLGPNGSMGTPASLAKVGRRANIAHTHSAGIFDGLYVAGTSSKLKWDYNYGPSSWTHSHIITYSNGMRCIVTMWQGKWRA